MNSKTIKFLSWDAFSKSKTFYNCIRKSTSNTNVLFSVTINLRNNECYTKNTVKNFPKSTYAEKKTFFFTYVKAIKKILICSLRFALSVHFKKNHVVEQKHSTTFYANGLNCSFFWEISPADHYVSFTHS